MSDQETSPFVPNLSKRRLTFAAPGSRRKRIWELPIHLHCPVVGVCLPLDVLRRLAIKVAGRTSLSDDYALHGGAVDACASRNPFSEAIQHELDRRYAVVVKRFSHIKSTQELASLWVSAVELGDVSATLWAAFTHAHCDDGLTEKISRDIHMIQHQTGAAKRTDVRKAQALIDEHGVLARELAKAQQRYTQLQNERVTERELLSADLIKARVECIGKDSLIAFLRTDLAELQASLPDLQTRIEMAQRIKEVSSRNGDLRHQIDTLKQQLEEATQQLDTARSAMQHMRNTQQPSTSSALTEDAVLPVDLGEKNVLCVGGRSGNVTLYRELIERVGGRFAHHDGGQEESVSRLDASLAAADMVICQTGCISHNAYWRVKDHCKRTGKRCVFVENPSTSSLDRALADIGDVEKAYTENL